jgi:hypothetical protein
MYTIIRYEIRHTRKGDMAGTLADPCLLSEEDYQSLFDHSFTSVGFFIC